ncbi:uncharacterized protein HD556DRAFT_1450676 [Suillus plorans]|uniref:FAD-binding FR-type domain-containing protein n=1 Tax=Suillus plorans TaxID=116603 RepID=A0A9P7AAE0_9AGAM|nr:uncharacterized protein HD556DRAFT_1450676 [Suillus plorans]KAG1785455.1 hypothetical protein HD556DRAFT_1450676 [Suillus plorans]
MLSESVTRLRLSQPPHFHWSPGQTAYLIMPSISTLPFEAHPFTIASFDSRAGIFGQRAGRFHEKVTVDGPYGPSPDLGSYDTSVLVAGGSGVSVFLDIIERVRKGNSSCTRVVFIWSIRGAEFVQWIEEALINAVQLAPPSLAISYPHLYHSFPIQGRRFQHSRFD